MEEESPEGGRFKKEIFIDNQSYLLLIRDEGGLPEMQVCSFGELFIQKNLRVIEQLNKRKTQWFRVHRIPRSTRSSVALTLVGRMLEFLKLKIVRHAMQALRTPNAFPIVSELKRQKPISKYVRTTLSILHNQVVTDARRETWSQRWTKKKNTSHSVIFVL